MNRKTISLMEAKFTLLYLLESVGDVTDLQLLDFVSEAELMNWFDMELAMLDLRDGGLVAELEAAGGPILAMTEDGRLALAAYSGRVPLSIRERIDQYLPKWQTALRSTAETPAEVLRLDSGTPCARMRLMEQGVPVLDLFVNTQTERAAYDMCKRWRVAAGAVFRKLTRTLSASQASAEERLTLAEVEETGDLWLVTMKSADGQMTVVSLIPDEMTARQFAAGWQRCASQLAAYILNELEKKDS